MNAQSGTPLDTAESFAAIVAHWRYCVEQMEKYGAGNCSEEFGYDVLSRDRAFRLLAHHPELAQSAAAVALAAIDCRYVAIGRRRTERFAPPLPSDIAAGRWWWWIVPMPKRSCLRRNRVWRGDVYNLVMKFANCGEVIAQDAAAMGREAHVDFILQVVYPPQLYRRHAAFIAHCADFLRECAARNGQTPSYADIAPRVDEQYGTIYAVRLEAAAPSVVIDGELRRVRGFKFEWLPDAPEYLPKVGPDPAFNDPDFGAY